MIQNTNLNTYMPESCLDSNIKLQYLALLENFLIYTKKKPLYKSLQETHTKSLNLPEFTFDDSELIFSNKKFIVHARVFVSDPLDRNLLELLLYPLSNEITIQHKILTFKNTSFRVFLENVIKDEKLRPLFIDFFDSLISEEFSIKKSTTLKQFRAFLPVNCVESKLKSDEKLTLNDRLLLTGYIVQTFFTEITLNLNSSHNHNSIFKFLLKLMEMSSSNLKKNKQK